MDSNPFYRMFIVAETTSILLQTVKLVFTELVTTPVSTASLYGYSLLSEVEDWETTRPVLLLVARTKGGTNSEVLLAASNVSFPCA